MTRPVKTKRDFVRRYRRGEFGNASPTWDSPSEFDTSGYRDGPVHLRNRQAGGLGTYDVNPQDVATELQKLVEKGVDTRDIYISAMAPHHLGTIQGEVIQSIYYLDLRYNTLKLPMRDGFAVESLRATGLFAVTLLKQYMNDCSWEWLTVLLRKYPGHVIEFSCFSRNWGTIPGFNTVFWEVRNY